MKVALVYDRVNKWGGAERVLLALNEMFPEAPLFTSVYSPETANWAQVFPEVIPSFLQKIPYARTHHEQFAWLMPLVFESLDLREYDVIISITSEAAKGIITHPHQKHMCFCLTPTRYLWSGYEEYFPNMSKRLFFRPLINYLRKWDKMASCRPDRIISISSEVQTRVQKYYNRGSDIIFPPVTFKKAKNKERKSFYLLVSRLVPYKKVDLAIEAFNQLKLPLVIVGTGSEDQNLRKLAQSNIKFLGTTSDLDLSKLYSQAKALIFPQREDFGLVAAEAHIHGTPVIAYKAGGALDIIIENENGVFFENQTVEDLVSAVKTFHKLKFNAKIISRSAERFSKERFQREFKKIL